MANYGILKYTCTVENDTYWGNWDNFHMTTQDLPISDYEILDWTITARVTLEIDQVYGEPGSNIFGARIGKRRAGSTVLWDWFWDENDPSVIDYKPSDDGKTYTIVIGGGGGHTSTSGPDVNTLDNVAIEPDFDPDQDGTFYIKAGSTVTLEIRHTGKSACFPPTSVTAPSYIHYHGGIKVAWNTAESGNKNPVSGYEVWRSRTRNGTYTRVASVGVDARSWLDYDYAIGDTWYYKVKALAADHNYDSALSAATAGTVALERTTPPTFRSGHAGAVYNPRPRILCTLGADALEESLIVRTSPPYIVGQEAPMQSAKVVLRRETAMSPGAESVTVTNTDTSGVSYSADAAVTVLSPSWTDDPIIAGETPVKAAHIMELRQCLDNICDYYDIPRTDWGGDVVAGVTPDRLWPTHMAAIQGTVRRIATFINSWDPISAENNIILPSLQVITRANARAMNQLREIILML